MRMLVSESRFLRACRDARSDGIPQCCGGIGGKASGRCFSFNATFRHYPASSASQICAPYFSA
jgi:hypothetical protein